VTSIELISPCVTLFRPPSPLSIDSYSGIYIGPQEKQRRRDSAEEDGGDIQVLCETAEASFSNGGGGLNSPGLAKRVNIKKMKLFSNKKKNNKQKSSFDRSKNICFKLFSKSINLSDKE
jgi:hypothetical protein